MSNFKAWKVCSLVVKVQVISDMNLYFWMGFEFLRISLSDRSANSRKIFAGVAFDVYYYFSFLYLSLSHFALISISVSLTFKIGCYKLIHIFFFVKCLGLTLFQFIFSYFSFSIQFCFIILTLFISDISHIFLSDFNRYSVSIFSTSMQLLYSEVYLFIYDFKRDKYHKKRWIVYLLIFTKYKRAIWQNDLGCHEIISYYHLLLLLNCIILI